MEWIIIALFISVISAALVCAFFMRRVVQTNEVHIVQSKKSTISYGKDQHGGNVYYNIPAWVPVFGVSVITLPVSVFDCDLKSYEAFDKGRLPFVLDVKGFFRVEDSNVAAQRVHSFADLRKQLEAILQGAVRTILAGHDIEAILSGRSQFGEQFTNEVKEQLKNWGVTTVKMIELMDIRDSHNSEVIANIMEKKKSFIERESRVEVASNRRAAEIAEIEADREVRLSRQDAEKQVGVRTAAVEQEVGISKQQSEQAVLTEEKNTAIRRADAQQVQVVRAQEIERDRQAIEAEAHARVKVITAEADKNVRIRAAEASLEETNLHAQGIKNEGDAKAHAESQLLLAPVNAQIALAKEIGSNPGYQQYLVARDAVEASKEVGLRQAGALEKSDIKIIANADNAAEGLTSAGRVISSKGGLNIASMLEGIAQTQQGQELLKNVGTFLNKSNTTE